MRSTEERSSSTTTYHRIPNPAVVNTGTITAEQATIILDGKWVKKGTVSANNSNIGLEGEFTTAAFESLNRSNSPVCIDGIMEKTGDVHLEDQKDGRVLLRDGTIVSGVIDATNGTLLAARQSGAMVPVVAAREMSSALTGSSAFCSGSISSTSPPP